MTHSAIVDRVLDLQSIIDRVQTAGSGAISVFIGAVRNENGGRSVTGIEYSAYREMAERELAAIIREVEAEYAGMRVAVEHRLGTLSIGEASVIIVAADPHRARVHAATSRVIEQIKRRVPIWKREHYTDGTREWVHAGSAAAGQPAPAEAGA
jgi:molybdopterin synthase catalytic subunit